MHYELLFPTLYIKACELKGKDVTLTILDAKLEEITMRGGKKKQKAILYFEELRKRVKDPDDQKRLVCNRTNVEIIVSMYGDYTKDWIGKKITLYPTTTKFGKKTVPCIRVRDGRQ